MAMLKGYGRFLEQPRCPLDKVIDMSLFWLMWSFGVPNAPRGVESQSPDGNGSVVMRTSFLMHRVELKAWISCFQASLMFCVPNVPRGVERKVGVE